MECDGIQHCLEDIEADGTVKLRRYVDKMVDEGSLSKAAKVLVSNGIWPRTEDVSQELERLHPHKDLPNPIDVTPPQTSFAAEEVLQAALSFPKGSAAGPSGFRPSHLREVLMCGISEIESTALTALTDFVNLCASGTLPIEIAQILLAASLIPFRKKNPREMPL